jgi:hypothetical protein
VPKVSRLVFRRSTVALAFSAYRMWRRLPPKQRRQIIEQTRKHGPRIAKKAVATARNRPRPKKK